MTRQVSGRVRAKLWSEKKLLTKSRSHLCLGIRPVRLRQRRGHRGRGAAPRRAALCDYQTTQVAFLWAGRELGLTGLVGRELGLRGMAVQA